MSKEKDSFGELIHVSLLKIWHSFWGTVDLASNDKLALLDENMVFAGIDEVNASIGTQKMETTPVAGGAHSTNLNLNKPALQGNTCQEILMYTNHNVPTEP